MKRHRLSPKHESRKSPIPITLIPLPKKLRGDVLAGCQEHRQVLNPARVNQKKGPEQKCYSLVVMMKTKTTAATKKLQGDVLAGRQVVNPPRLNQKKGPEQKCYSLVTKTTAATKTAAMRS